MHTRCAGSHSFLAAVWWGTTLMRPESFLQNGPTQLLQSFFKRLPDHQTDIERGSTHPTQLEIEVDHFNKVLQTHLVDVTSDPALMLDFRCGIKSILTIDLTRQEAVLHYPLLKGNIADNPEELPTRRMVAKPSSLQTRNQFTNAATGPHLDLEMVQSAMIGTSSLMVERTSIPMTISLFTAFIGQAECFS